MFGEQESYVANQGVWDWEMIQPEMEVGPGPTELVLPMKGFNFILTGQGEPLKNSCFRSFLSFPLELFRICTPQDPVKLTLGTGGMRD